MLCTISILFVFDNQSIKALPAASAENGLTIVFLFLSSLAGDDWFCQTAWGGAIKSGLYPYDAALKL